MQPAGKTGGNHGAAGSGKVDLNFFLRGTAKSNFFDGRDWSERKAGQPFFAHITIMETHKGALFLDQLRHEMGDTRFFQVMGDFFSAASGSGRCR